MFFFFLNAANITVAPSPVNTLINTLAKFTCEAIGDKLKWTVHGISTNDPSNQDREISVTTNNISVDVWSSVLTIRALPINDGMSISCTVISFISHGYEKRGATLTVLG